MEQPSLTNLISMEKLERITPILRNTVHPLRLRILDYLQHAGEPQTVSQIIEAAEAPQASVSQQLRILKDTGIVTARRDGVHILYGIANPNVLVLLDCIRRH